MTLSLRLLSTLSLLAVAIPITADADGKAKHYVCPSCDLECDKLVFDKPGKCPYCNMQLVEAGSAAASPKAHQAVAILVFDGVEIIDFSGPYEVFAAADFDVFTVGATKQPVTSAAGLTLVPRYSFADAPAPTVLVVPGGSVRAARQDPGLLKWIKDTTAHTAHTMSVCNGAFILANAGLLQGLTATTTARLIPSLRSEFPQVRVVDDQRFVDNGHIITTAGLSAGIDGALHVVEKLRGRGSAQLTALGIEYDWRPDVGFARAALADRALANLDFDLDHWELVNTAGTTDKWEMILRARTKVDSKEVLPRFAHMLSDGKWTRIRAAEGESDWQFNDDKGRRWNGHLLIQAGAPPTVKLSIARAP